MSGWRIALLLAALVTAPLSAASFEPHTGDSVMDGQLAGLNGLAGPARDALVDELVTVFGAPRYFVRSLLEQRHWQAGDVYYACALAYRLRRPCADVVHDHGQEQGNDWGAIARKSGIRPGTAAFRALKDQLGKSAARLQAISAAAPEAPAGPAKDQGN